MPGVTIKLDSMLLGTATDVNGKFVLELPVSSGNLVCSFVGYKTKKVPFKGNKDLVVILEEDISELDEVHVVAYGQTNKREMTGSHLCRESRVHQGNSFPKHRQPFTRTGSWYGRNQHHGSPRWRWNPSHHSRYNSLSVESGRRFSNPCGLLTGLPMASFTSPCNRNKRVGRPEPRSDRIHPNFERCFRHVPLRVKSSQRGNHRDHQKGRKNQSAQFDVNFSYTYNVLPEYPVQTGGKAERNFRLLQRFNARKAYKDQDKNMYIYPISYEEAYTKGGSYDAYWGRQGLFPGTRTGMNYKIA